MGEPLFNGGGPGEATEPFEDHLWGPVGAPVVVGTRARLIGALEKVGQHAAADMLAIFVGKPLPRTEANHCA
jgi:hypothetical protein